jgi:tRNA-dihydrouridine synthase B
VDAAREHFERSVLWKGDHEGVVEMRRHYANYFKGLPDFKDHRMKLVTERDPRVVLELLEMVRSQFAVAA